MKSTTFDGLKFDKMIDSKTFDTQPYTQITLYFAKMGNLYVVMSEWKRFVQYCSEKSEIHLIVVTSDYEKAKNVYSRRVARLEKKYDTLSEAREIRFLVQRISKPTGGI